MKITHSHIILDACCILNFSASGQLLAILESIPARIVVTQVVKERELMTLKRLEEEINEEALQFEAAIAQGKLIVVDFESEEEEESFVNYVFELGDDGESASCAIAFHRGWAIATDDRKAIKVIQRDASHLQVISTSEIMKHWSEESEVDSLTLREALNSIRVNGHFVPRKSDPLRSWWEAASADINPGKS